jgi:predicted acyltransferase
MTGHLPDHAPARANSPRWQALDAFRGLAIIGMLLVNNPGDHDAVYSQLAHSAWNGCTIADLVFPAFLFVVGITTVISLESHRTMNDPHPVARIWRRAGLIFLIGLLLNWFPFYQSGSLSWTQHPGPVDRVVARLLVLRIPGVLQRIAVAYLCAALIARQAGARTIALLTALILLGYWALLTIVPVPGEGAIGAVLFDEPARVITAHADRALFDWTRWGLGNHLWDSASTWDPEGLLSTLPAIATVLLGVLCARWVRSGAVEQRIRSLTLGAIVTVLIGAIWSFVFPLNKPLWTSSYVLFTAGISGLVLATISLIMMRRPRARWAAPLLVFGANPLVAYVGSELARRILHSTIKIKRDGHRIGTDEWVVRMLESLGVSPKAASLAWSLLLIAAVWAGLRELNRRRLFLRV